MSLPTHLIIPILISAYFLWEIGLNSKRLYASGEWQWFWIASMVFLVTYIRIVGGAVYADLNAQWALSKFDLNGDGIFSGNETTPEQIEAMNNLTHDTGRSFSIFTAIVPSAVLALLVFIGGNIVKFIVLKINRYTKQK